MESKKQISSRPKATETDEGFSLSALLRGSFIGLAVMLIVSLIFIIIGASIAYSASDPGVFTLPLSLVSLYAGVFAGSFAAAKASGQNKLLIGFVFAALSLVVTLFIKLMLMGDNSTGISNSTTYLVGMVATAFLASLFASVKIVKRRRGTGRKSSFKKKRK
ncbi:MAG: YrzE family protein [Clostridia bacterium]|nr:YrzE family protein [Clostridia bacterium]